MIVPQPPSVAIWSNIPWVNANMILIIQGPKSRDVTKMATILGIKVMVCSLICVAA